VNGKLHSPVAFTTGRLQNRSERCDEEEHLSFLPRIETQFLDPLARSLVAIPAELLQLLLLLLVVVVVVVVVAVVLLLLSS
jgi:hypothetical protein